MNQRRRAKRPATAERRGHLGPWLVLAATISASLLALGVRFDAPRVGAADDPRLDRALGALESTRSELERVQARLSQLETRPAPLVSPGPKGAGSARDLASAVRGDGGAEHAAEEPGGRSAAAGAGALEGEPADDRAAANRLGDAAATEVRPPSTPAEAAARMQEVLTAEPTDPAWAGRREAELRAAVAGAAREGGWATQVECRSSLCRVELEHPRAEGLERSRAQLAVAPALVGRQVFWSSDPGDPTKTVLYASRAGRDLARALLAPAAAARP
jgi:hypothetical protein